jgi:hypothetical protein
VPDRWSVLPLADLVAQGKGSLRLPIRVRCQASGEPGRLRLLPPMPTWVNSNRWLEIC